MVRAWVGWVVYVPFSMLCFCVWPGMVLNQRQVSLVVSDWESYLGSLFPLVWCGCLFSVSVCSTWNCLVGVYFLCLCSTWNCLVGVYFLCLCSTQNCFGWLFHVSFIVWFQCSLVLVKSMNTYHAAHCSSDPYYSSSAEAWTFQTGEHSRKKVARNEHIQTSQPANLGMDGAQSAIPFGVVLEFGSYFNFQMMFMPPLPMARERERVELPCAELPRPVSPVYGISWIPQQR